MLVVSTFCITLRFDRALLELEAIDSHFGLDELLLQSIVLKCKVLLLALLGRVARLRRRVGEAAPRVVSEVGHRPLPAAPTRSAFPLRGRPSSCNYAISITRCKNA